MVQVIENHDVNDGLKEGKQRLNKLNQKNGGINNGKTNHKERVNPIVQ